MLLGPVEPRGGKSQEVMLGGITTEALLEHAHSFEAMNGLAIRNTLIPYRGLPLHDPAGYIIAYHQIINPKGGDVLAFAVAIENEEAITDINSSYDLGVVFASSLLRAHMPSGTMPVISSFDGDRSVHNLIESYLHGSMKRSIKKLTSNSDLIHPELDSAVEIFLTHYQKVEPTFLQDDADEVRRGCHDFLSVVALLEDGPSLLRQYLGRTGVLRRLIGRHHR